MTFPSVGETQSSGEAHGEPYVHVNKLLAHTVKRISHLFDSARQILSDEYGLSLVCQQPFLLGHGEDPHLVPRFCAA